MKEYSVNLLSLCYRHKQNKQSQPNILLFITLLSKYLPGICFYYFITFFFTFCVSGHFFDWRCNPNVAIGDQTAAYEETARCSMDCFQYRQVASHIFVFFNDYILPFTAAVTKCYDLACQLCSFNFLDVCSFWIWVLVIEFLFEWRACTRIYTVFRRLF